MARTRRRSTVRRHFEQVPVTRVRHLAVEADLEASQAPANVLVASPADKTEPYSRPALLRFPNGGGHGLRES